MCAPVGSANMMGTFQARLHATSSANFSARKTSHRLARGSATNAATDSRLAPRHGQVQHSARANATALAGFTGDVLLLLLHSGTMANTVARKKASMRARLGN